MLESAGWFGVPVQDAVDMSTRLHAVEFSKPVAFTGHTGVTFVNTTTAETAAVPVTTGVFSPASIIEYLVDWVVDPVAGDVVEWRLDNTAGDYTHDASGLELDDQVITLTNCLGSAP